MAAEHSAGPRRFPHALFIAVTFLLALAIMAVIDGLDDQGITWWTGAKAIGVSILVLVY